MELWGQTEMYWMDQEGRYENNPNVRDKSNGTSGHTSESFFLILIVVIFIFKKKIRNLKREASF